MKLVKESVNQATIAVIEEYYNLKEQRNKLEKELTRLKPLVKQLATTTVFVA